MTCGSAVSPDQAIPKQHTVNSHGVAVNTLTRNVTLLPAHRLPDESPRLLFGLTVYDESDAQLEWCLAYIRAAYEESPVFVLADGTQMRRHEDACRKYRADYIAGERLKIVEKGAQWWERFFRTAVTYPFDIVLKIDPDTRVHRRFTTFPTADIFGTDDGGGRIQGGIQAFRLSAVKMILHSGICLDPAYADPATWAVDQSVSQYVQILGQISTDYILGHMVQRLELTLADWIEVDSLWRPSRAFRSGVAATHPHKVTAGGE